MEKSARIFIADNHGLIGDAIRRRLRDDGFENILGDSGKPSLIDARELQEFFSRTLPEYVFAVGGKSGGIGANQKLPADLILDNLLVDCHVIDNAYRCAVKKLLYMGSSCCYPRACLQPMQVSSLMTGVLESTNEAYATAKLAGIKLSQAYRQQHGVDTITAIPANVFGPGDDFGVEDSHVIAALMVKMHQAKLLQNDHVDVWGSGAPRREFIYVGDVADAAIFLMNNYSSPVPINLGSGSDASIREIAELIKEVVGYSGELRFDPKKPDGMPLKSLDSTELFALGWQPQVPLRLGLEKTYQWYLENCHRNA
ncbi:MAG TPA: GDP-L-fucose synthase [Candidatus Binatia bacterium]|nr:GDP-L-fucose synthase [Candidatus Binatia bacterium]